MKRTPRHSPSPKRLTAIQTSRHLHVAHRKHTGRVLPRTSTSYPMLVMIVLVVGVLIASWTRVVQAATPVGSPQLQSDYTVHASVPGPAPTTAATITSPLSQAHITATPLTVTGSCPVDAQGGYVSLYRNNFYSGTALCEAGGTYQLATDLFAGANQLIARVYNFTDVAGPDSNPVTVYYTPSASVTSVSGGTAQTSTGGANRGFSVNSAPSSAALSNTSVPVVPLSLTTNFTIRGYYVGRPSDWQLDIEGGTAPYALATDWGDGTTGIASRPAAGLTKLTHIYAKPGGAHGSYVVKFTATDAAGNQTFLQALVVVNPRQPAASGAARAGGSIDGLGSSMLHIVRTYVWPSYGVVLLMLSSFWLGERRELHLLRLHHRRARHA